jgi:polysaccharide export outer membrane protein
LLGIFSIGLLLFLPGNAFAQKNYLLGPEDVIEIIVWGHDDLTRRIPVSLDGTITFPMIGEVKAIGKSTQDLEKEMAEKLGDGYLVNPQITISVKEYKSQKVFVMGQVEKQGIYPITQENKLLFFLSQAGGPSTDKEKAPGEEVIIIRPKNPVSWGMTLEEAAQKKETIIKVNLKDALAGDPKHNITIQNGDSIIVPRMEFFFVLGEVNNPGQFNLERGTNALMALSKGGGPTKDADEDVLIIRPKNPSTQMTLEEAEAKQETIIKINLQELLAGNSKHHIPIQHGDSIVVPRMPFFFVTGQVNRPDMYRLEKGMNVLKGISKGGGLTPKAAEKRVKIMREVGGKKLEIKATMETLILPGDTIVVPESFF